MKKAFFFIVLLSLTFIDLQVPAQTTDSVFVTKTVKPYLDNSLPEGVDIGK